MCVQHQTTKMIEEYHWGSVYHNPQPNTFPFGLTCLSQYKYSKYVVPTNITKVTVRVSVATAAGITVVSQGNCTVIIAVSNRGLGKAPTKIV